MAGSQGRAASGSWLCDLLPEATLLGLFPVCKEGIIILAAVLRLNKANK